MEQSALSAGMLMGAGYFTSRAAADPKSPNEKLNIAIIGAANRGAANTDGVRAENIVALCDVDERHLGQAGGRFPKAARFNDFRKMLDEVKEIEAVVVSTADHCHAPASIRAMRLGKHVYSEKPLGHTVQEARWMRETYRKAKVATQMGTQIHATDNYRRVVELVQAGAIGPVREAHVWCDRVGPGGGRPTPEQTVPAYLHWDLWLGPAPERPYANGYHPGNLVWNRFWDFGNGTMGDMGSHLIDLPFWALNLKQPKSVEATGLPSPYNPETCPVWLIAKWEHEKRGAGPHEQAIELTWYDGKKRPPTPDGIDLSKWGIGVIFKGDDGILVADYDKHVLLPEEKFKEYRRPAQSIAPSLGHHQEWIQAAKTGSATLCNFEYSGALIEHNLLATVAYRVGKKLDWDAENLKATNAPEADRFIRKTYRKGWEI
jgi:predicted dehydrogenase